MPRPLYILCSESGSEDKVTGLVSHFNIIEQIELRDIPERQDRGQPGPIGFLSMRMIAVWSATDLDRHEQEFEYDMRISLPPDNKETILKHGTFFFDKKRFRITLILHNFVPRTDGVVRFESRVRKLGDPDWISQDYPISIVRIPASKESNPLSTEERT